MVKAETMRNFEAPTVEAERILHYAKMSEIWWKPNHGIYLLYALNSMRIPWVVESLIETGAITQEKSKNSKPLEGIRILDAGCGGGFAAEAFAELGATVVAIDPIAELIDIAKERQLRNSSLKNITYINGIIEHHVEENREKYDVVFTSNVLVHVKDRDLFLQLCIECLKPGGQLFITSLNKTWLAWLTYIVMYEYVFGVLAFGSHRYEILIEPEIVEHMLKKQNCRTLSIRGYCYNYFYKRWTWRSSTSLEYALHAVKEKR